MKLTLIKTMVVLSMVVGLAFAVPSTSSAEELSPMTLSWVAGGVGGGWYVQAGGIARMIAEKEPKLIIKVVPGGGVVNPVRVSNHKDDLGWGITFVDKMALKASNRFTKNRTRTYVPLAEYLASTISTSWLPRIRGLRRLPRWWKWSKQASQSRLPPP